jgi:hypothetical protein
VYFIKVGSQEKQKFKFEHKHKHKFEHKLSCLSCQINSFGFA